MASVILDRAIERHLPTLSRYSAFMMVREVFGPPPVPGLRLRGEAATLHHLRRVIRNLLETTGLTDDPDYPTGYYRVPAVADAPADEVCCTMTPLGFISHLSAMQRWGLTDRRPTALHLTMPQPRGAAETIRHLMRSDYGVDISTLPHDQVVRLTFVRHPAVVRGRSIDVYSSDRPRSSLTVRGGFARLATVGQTFLDMVAEPHRCGGMGHVIETWQRHGPTFADEIIAAIDQRGEPIDKVRAGFLLQETLRIENPTILSWQRFAQPGGSRVLDPARPFTRERYSQPWMLSLNV